MISFDVKFIMFELMILGNVDVPAYRNQCIHKITFLGVAQYMCKL